VESKQAALALSGALIRFDLSGALIFDGRLYQGLLKVRIWRPVMFEDGSVVSGSGAAAGAG
jgi:hypothetical protein